MPSPGNQPSVEPVELPRSLFRRHQSWDHEAIFDVVVIGAGIAGLAFTLRLPEGLRVGLVTKGALGESNTRYAQGGLAAAMGTDDSPELHFADTMAAGAGLCDPSAVSALVERGPAAVRWLLAQGTRFDAADGRTLALGREAAHSRRRVLHAGGDATGAEIERALVARVRSRPNTDVLERSTALDLLLGDHGCGGAIVRTETGATYALRARTTVLANGGAGQLWAVTSNPPAATGDGIAITLRAGVAVADLEFTQFHPTVLDLPNAPPFLISEAVRGEGAYLRNRAGERFMVDGHSLAELAPRDVVARAIQRELADDGSPSVWLDLRHLDPSRMAERFPTIAAHLHRHGLHLTRNLLPVAPAAHYFMGGIVASTAGATSLPGLLALGEVACTGVHGANRLASNSLLEGLVFGLNAADYLAQSDLPDLVALPLPCSVTAGPDGHDHTHSLREALQATMSRDVAVVRDATGLQRAASTLADIASQIAANDTSSELRGMTLLATAIVAAARRREESRGAHFRADFPAPDEGLDGLHQLLTTATSGYQLRYGVLREGIAVPTHS